MNTNKEAFSKRTILIILILFLLFLYPGHSLFSGEKYFTGWETGLCPVIGVKLAKVEDFELKSQFSGRVEAALGTTVYSWNNIDYILRGVGGFHLAAPSSLDGGYSYSGFTGFYTGLLAAAEGPAYFIGFLNDPHWNASGGILTEWAEYENTYNKFFFPAARIEGGIDFRLNTFKDGRGQFRMAIGLPLEWSFRRDMDVDFTAGLRLGVILKMEGKK